MAQRLAEAAAISGSDVANTVAWCGMDSVGPWLDGQLTLLFAKRTLKEGRDMIVRLL